MPISVLLLFSVIAWQCHSPDKLAPSFFDGEPELSELKRERASIDSLLGQIQTLPEEGRMDEAYDRFLMFDKPIMLYIDDWDCISPDSLFLY